ncbi:MAG TPA: hypothetical protein VI757_02385 [Bacteroidia bacterium]|nr:hypothetical protein [Bacteroidia bacterium]
MENKKLHHDIFGTDQFSYERTNWVKIIYDINYKKLDLQIVLKYAQLVVDTENELRVLLAQKEIDYEKIQELDKKRSEYMEHYHAMSFHYRSEFCTSNPYERLYIEKEIRRQLNDAINGKIDF